MKKFRLLKIGFALLTVALLPAITNAQEGKATIAVSSIKATPSLDASVKPDKKLELGRIIESMNSQLIDRINATRKFDVVGRSDLNTNNEFRLTLLVGRAIRHDFRRLALR